MIQQTKFRECLTCVSCTLYIWPLSVKTGYHRVYCSPGISNLKLYVRFPRQPSFIHWTITKDRPLYLKPSCSAGIILQHGSAMALRLIAVLYVIMYLQQLRVLQLILKYRLVEINHLYSWFCFCHVTLFNLSSLDHLSQATVLPLQLHANQAPVLQRRKGGKPNWIECNSVHRAGNESIMLRNGFRRTECPPWVRGFFCLQHNLGLHAYVFYDRLIKNPSTFYFTADISSWDAGCAALQKMSCLFDSVKGRLEWSFHWFAFSSCNVFTENSWANKLE